MQESAGNPSPGTPRSFLRSVLGRYHVFSIYSTRSLLLQYHFLGFAMYSLSAVYQPVQVYPFVRFASFGEHVDSCWCFEDVLFLFHFCIVRIHLLGCTTGFDSGSRWPMLYAILSGALKHIIVRLSNTSTGIDIIHFFDMNRCRARDRGCSPFPSILSLSLAFLNLYTCLS